MPQTISPANLIRLYSCKCVSAVITAFNHDADHMIEAYSIHKFSEMKEISFKHEAHCSVAFWYRTCYINYLRSRMFLHATQVLSVSLFDLYF